MTTQKIAIIGGGLAGSECALYIARPDISVTIFEQKPKTFSQAHTSPFLAELVCSNSFRSKELTTGVGLLKQELRDLYSPLMTIADMTCVPSGKALAVDRERFASQVTQCIEAHPYITVVHKEITALDCPLLKNTDSLIIAAGPLASKQLSMSLATAVGDKHLYFYDAIAPIISADSVDMSIAFWGSRYGKTGEGDYLNCPMTQEEYDQLYHAILAGKKVPCHHYEKEAHFEGCMPIEALAERGPKTLTFGPLKPIGFIDPRTGKRPYALLQLRPENINKDMFNLVGCQTKLTYPAQEYVFRKIPGLANVEFVRFGSMHRNTYVNAPKTLTKQLTLQQFPHIYLAGQITGVEGYVESIACGLWVGMLLVAKTKHIALEQPPITSALGGLLGHLLTPTKKFQPSNIHFGLVPAPHEKIKKKLRKEWYAHRARSDFQNWLQEYALPSCLSNT